MSNCPSIESVYTHVRVALCRGVYHSTEATFLFAQRYGKHTGGYNIFDGRRQRYLPTGVKNSKGWGISTRLKECSNTLVDAGETRQKWKSIKELWFVLPNVSSMIDEWLENSLRARAKISSQSWRSDLVQIWPIRLNKTAGIASYFEGFVRLRRKDRPKMG